MNNNQSFFEVAGALAVIAAVLFYQALVLALGWQWFVVPLGAQSIGYAHALGLSALVYMATGARSNDSVECEPVMALFKAFVRITVILGLMFIYSLFI